MTPRIDIGIDQADRQSIADGLSHLLADSYSLYLKTHGFHWNVKGPMFTTLHALFMEQYVEQWSALDLIAERIRALGFDAPSSYSEFISLSSIQETQGTPKALEMVALLLKAQEQTAKTARNLVPVADRADDSPTADILVQRINVHEKNAWILRSILDDGEESVK